MNILFEPTVTLGAIAQTLVLLGGIIGWGMKINTDISSIKTDISNLQTSNKNFAQAFNQLGTILTQVAVQDNRILNVERRTDELAHGKGFIRED